MSAIEMMDVKMDAGMMCNQIRRKVLDLPQSIEVRTINWPFHRTLVSKHYNLSKHYNKEV